MVDKITDLKLLERILRPFQSNEESLFVSLVCKQWNSVIKPSKSITNKQVLKHYSTMGNIPSLKLVRRTMRDTKFFRPSLWSSASPETAKWAHQELQNAAMPEFFLVLFIKGAAEGGHLDLLKSFPFKKYTKVGFIKKIKNKINKSEPNAIQEAIKFGDICASAAKGGQMHVIEWAKASGYGVMDRAWSKAARSGHLEVLKMASTWDLDGLCYFAAKGGQLETLKWLKEQGATMESTCEGAAAGGHLDVVLWGKSNGYELGKNFCYLAAQGGLDMLKWARENGCDWDDRVCDYAAGKGKLEILKWARENGCPWDKDMCLSRAKKDSVREWIEAH